MEKMLYFAKILAVEIRKANEIFLEGIPVYHSVFREMLRGTKLRIEGNRYIELETLWEHSDVEEDEGIWYISEDENELSDYVVEKDEIENLAGVLICNEFLYEVLYDFVMLGHEFKTKEMKESAQTLMKNLYKIAEAFRLNVSFCNGYIYFCYEKKPLEDGTFICKTMAEVSAVGKLREGASILDTRDSSGMSKEEFKQFMERLKQHEWNQVS